MSSNLRAEPTQRAKLELGTGLKFALRKVYGEPVDRELSSHDLAVLEGIKAAGNEETSMDAEKLFNFIELHGTVLVKEEY